MYGPDSQGQLNHDNRSQMVNQHHFDRVVGLIQDALDRGATLVHGGIWDAATRRIAPTVLDNVTMDMAIMKEEIFGPVLVIIPFEDESDAISIANDTPYGLAAYLQTGDSDRAQRVASKLRAGAVHINGGGFEYGSPFGGYKQSGNGREGGMMGLEDYLETKTLHGLG